MVERRVLAPLVLVRIQVPQPEAPGSAPPPLTGRRLFFQVSATE